MLDYIAIGFVLEESITGYGIKKNIENRTGLFYKASFSLYPTLKKLTEKGFLNVWGRATGESLFRRPQTPMLRNEASHRRQVIRPKFKGHKRVGRCAVFNRQVVLPSAFEAEFESNPVRL